MLNITGVHNAVTACGLWSHGPAISRAFACVRLVRGKKLMDVPARIKAMAAAYVDYRACMLLTLPVVSLLHVSENSKDGPPPLAPGELVPSDNRKARSLLRVLTPVVKAMTAKAAIAGLAECIKSLCSVGYLDSSSPLDIETKIARLYGDADVLSIWEGTTDVMAKDMIRALKGQGGAEDLAALSVWIGKNYREVSTTQ